MEPDDSVRVQLFKQKISTREVRLRLWPLGGLAFCSSGGGAKGDLLVALAGADGAVDLELQEMCISMALLVSL